MLQGQRTNNNALTRSVVVHAHANHEGQECRLIFFSVGSCYIKEHVLFVTYSFFVFGGKIIPFIMFDGRLQLLVLFVVVVLIVVNYNYETTTSTFLFGLLFAYVSQPNEGGGRLSGPFTFNHFSFLTGIHLITFSRRCELTEDSRARARPHSSSSAFVSLPLTLPFSPTKRLFFNTIIISAEACATTCLPE